MTRPILVYTYRGRVERGSRYEWRDGYSATHEDGGVLYPWMTRRECRVDAKSKGMKAEFHRDGEKEG